MKRHNGGLSNIGYKAIDFVVNITVFGSLHDKHVFLHVQWVWEIDV